MRVQNPPEQISYQINQHTHQKQAVGPLSLGECISAAV